MHTGLLVTVLLFIMLPCFAETERGQRLYEQTCIACHGKNGKGSIPGVADLTKEGGPLGKADSELFSSIHDGFQTPGAALSMPPKGGNPALTDADISALIEYLRSKQFTSR